MPVRETFWNIPYWAEVGQYILGALVVIVFFYGVWRHFRRWRSGQPVQRIDHPGQRLASLFLQGVLQFRTAEEPYAGAMHLGIFWGMVVLFLGTVLATVDWEVTRLFFGYQFLRAGFYLFYELVLDLFGLLLLVGLGMAAYRRYVIRPKRLQKPPLSRLTWEDAYALGILALVAVTGYLVESLRIAVVQPDWSAWSPLGRGLASLFASLGDPTNRSLHFGLWLSHTLVAFTFIASVPYTKMFHLIAVPVNIFTRSLEPAGRLAPARSSSGPGVSQWRQFTWKQILDFESCTRCGRCQDQCPTFAAGLPLSPRDLMVKLAAHIWQAGNNGDLHGSLISSQELWSCTTCRSCVQVCPAFTDQVGSIVDMRRYLVFEGQIDNMLQEALINLGRYGNSFGQSERMRTRWTQAVQPKIKDARREPVKYLWFVGDYASYSATLADATRKTATVFQRAGLDFGILYEAERNAGNDVRRVGEEALFEILVERNLAALQKCDFKAILTTDPHSYNTLKNEYPNDGRFTVLHYTELLDHLVASGQLKFSNKLDSTVTYHDPCYLGRYNNVYEAPRRVIAATGCKLVEMPRNSERALCCGAGGGRIWMEESPMKERPSEARIKEAASLPGVEALVVACPKDVTMYTDALKTTGNEDRLAVKDLIELVYEAI